MKSREFCDIHFWVQFLCQNLNSCAKLRDKIAHLCPSDYSITSPLPKLLERPLDIVFGSVLQICMINVAELFPLKSKVCACKSQSIKIEESPDKEPMVQILQSQTYVLG